MLSYDAAQIKTFHLCDYYRAADLQLCFHYTKATFLMSQLILKLAYEAKILTAQFCSYLASTILRARYDLYKVCQICTNKGADPVLAQLICAFGLE